MQRLQADMAVAANSEIARACAGSCEGSLTARAAAAVVQVVNPVRRPDWGGLVAGFSDFSFFHGAAWAKTLEGTYGYAPIYLTAEEEGTVRSLLPLMEVNSRLTGRRGITLPFTDECGPLYEDSAWAHRLIQSAATLGKSRGWNSMEFRGGRELFPNAPASVSFYGHRLSLEGNEEAMFGLLDGSTRRAIRKAEKSGVRVSVSGGMDAMKTFYTLHCKTRRRHGLPPQPFTFFSNICRHIFSRDQGMVIVASCGNRPIAASVYFQSGERAIYKFGASDESFQHVRGSSLVMWEAIKRLARHGARTLDMGRTSVGNEGLRRFKLNWGAREYKIEYVKYDLRQNAFVTDRDGATGWHNRVFRALPLGLSRMIGAALYRHLA
jgi:CelD/BcsL family acetyltransferase involved in cellulose biosynthesis